MQRKGLNNRLLEPVMKEGLGLEGLWVWDLAFGMLGLRFSKTSPLSVSIAANGTHGGTDADRRTHVHKVYQVHDTARPRP